jgi:hypothetical protein
LLGDSYVDAPLQAFHNADFIDEGHFSHEGAVKFAGYVVPTARAVCRR